MSSRASWSSAEARTEQRVRDTWRRMCRTSIELAKYQSRQALTENIRSKNRLRRTQSTVMYGVSVLFTLLILALLALVIRYLVTIGWPSVTLDFFTKVPMP